VYILHLCLRDNENPMRLTRLIPLFAAALIAACTTPNKAPDHTSVADIKGHGETKVLVHPEWSKNATIYEVNIRQHTPEGTFAAFERDLPRIKSMGADILWLMPIHPIGEINRKGGLGSHYSVKDYKGVNPNYGTLDDFKRLVSAAHALGMKIIIDWVPNHSSFDNIWTTQHPEYYLLDSAGKIQPPLGTDWTDVAQLDYNSDSLRIGMIDAMSYWLKECDIDGFRCDVAMKVPTSFWNQARAALDNIKPVFMLAEAEQSDLHLKAFDMTYTWEFMHLCNEIAAGKMKLEEIDTYLAKQDTAFKRSAYRMYFTTNHDENSWNGTGSERLKKARQTFDVLCFTMPGMPLLYSGQEGGEQKADGTPHRLSFFEKDTVQWNNYPYQDFYSRLLNAHHKNPALWNGEFGGDMKRLKTSNDQDLYCYKRTKDNNTVLVLLNFSDKTQSVDFVEDVPVGDFKSIFNSQTFTLFSKGNEQLQPYGYQVFVNP
jgi:glycosidase